MGVPRWFYLTIAACAIAVSSSVTWSLVFQPAVWIPEAAYNNDALAIGELNTRTGVFCMNVPGRWCRAPADTASTTPAR